MIVNSAPHSSTIGLFIIQIPNQVPKTGKQYDADSWNESSCYPGTYAGAKCPFVMKNSRAKVIDQSHTDEYYTEYGVAHVGSSKGTAAENLTRNCDFHQQVSGAALVHGQAIIWWVDGCNFWDESPTKILARQAQNSNSSFCWITDCYAHDEDDFEGANNAGWDAVGIRTALNGVSQGSDNLTGDNWV